MGAVERNSFRFVPEYSVISQNGAIHVYKKGEFVEEIKFSFHGKFPELDQIEDLIDDYCEQKEI